MGSALVVTTQPPGCSEAQAGFYPPACLRDFRVQPELGDTWDPPGPVHGEMWHFPITTQVSCGGDNHLLSLTRSVQAAHPPCTFSGYPEGQLLGLPPLWEDGAMVSDARAGSRVCVCPLNVVPMSAPTQPAPCTEEGSQNPPLQMEGK